MEPRPPRPRSSHPFESPGSPETAGIGERLYPAPGEPAYYSGAEAYAPGAPAASPLLPRAFPARRGPGARAGDADGRPRVGRAAERPGNRDADCRTSADGYCRAGGRVV